MKSVLNRKEIGLLIGTVFLAVVLFGCVKHSKIIREIKPSDNPISETVVIPEATDSRSGDSRPLAPSVTSGTTDGGGGKVVVCRDGNKITSVVLLDLYEVKKLFDKEIRINELSVDEKIRKAISFIKFDNEHRKIVNTGLNYRALLELAFEIKKNMKPLDDIHLSLTEDSYEAVYPRGCSVEQLGVYQLSSSGKINKSGRLLVDNFLYKKLDDTNKAAFILHEAIYEGLRINFGDKDSIRTRRIVGLIFSGEKIKPVYPKIKGRNYLICTQKAKSDMESRDEQIEFRVFPSQQNSEVRGQISSDIDASEFNCVDLYFARVGSRVMVTESVFSFCVKTSIETIFVAEKVEEFQNSYIERVLLKSDIDNYWTMGLGFSNNSKTMRQNDLDFTKINRWIDFEINKNKLQIEYQCVNSP